MIQPIELKIDLPVELSNGVISTTTDVWQILSASYEGNLEKVKGLVKKCPELAYAQYNYAPPIHFAVREGYLDLVKYLLSLGAHDPSYKIYPFQEDLLTLANDRNHNEIVRLLSEYQNDSSRWRFKGDNGVIRYPRSELQQNLQTALDENDIETATQILSDHPDFVQDPLYFWAEGILMMPAKEGNKELVELLLGLGASVPPVLKWGQEYYFKRYEMAAFLMEQGMSPNVMSWHHVTLLHDMAQKGNLEKAELLVRHGAELNPIDEEYQSTPLGLAVRWGNHEMVKLLLSIGADPNTSGASWSRPLAWARTKNHQFIEETLIKAGAVS